MEKNYEMSSSIDNDLLAINKRFNTNCRCHSWSDESIRRRFDSEHTIISYSQDYLRQFGANGKSEALSHLGSETAR